MNGNTPKKKDGQIIADTLDRLSNRRKAPIGLFFVLIVLYIAASYLTRRFSDSQGTIPIGDARFPVTAMAGTFSSLSNICIIFMAVYYDKIGYLAAMGISLIQLPVLFAGIALRHNYSSLPGVFNNLLTIIAITVIFLNDSQLNKYQIRLRNQAVTDRLTGLPNRFACSELLTDVLRRGTPFALVSIDLNGFKSINDTMGFDAGNLVLTEIAARWKEIADTGDSGTLDFITRTGGDEFVLIIRNYHTPDELLKTIRKYEAALGKRLTVDGCDFYISASFGYAEYPKDGTEKNALFTAADAAMQEVKRVNSSNHIIRFAPEMLKEEHTLEIERKIRQALEHETIYYNLQPQFNMNHKLRGFEALARMKDDEGNFISPGDFIPVAEKVGLIDKVDGMVIRKAAIFFGEMLRKFNLDMTLSVNVSVRHMMKNDFLDEVREVLRVSGVPANRLEIEITESIMIESAEKALQCINEIRNMGIMLAIDDFGTGYSSLSYLSNFPANLLKIDKSFIDKMNSSESSRQYVAAIISIGHIMGFEVISEGVEVPEQLDTLRSIGCDFVQGFIWGRPLMPDAAETLVMQEAALNREHNVPHSQQQVNGTAAHQDENLPENLTTSGCETGS